MDDDYLKDFALRDYLYKDEALQENDKKVKPKKITIYVNCIFQDPENEGVLKGIPGSISCEANKPVGHVCKDFMETFKGIPNKTYYLGYDSLLFREGTLEECGITHGKTVEMISPGKNSSAYHNEGLSLIFYSIVPLVLGLSAVIFSVSTMSVVSYDYQALFLFVGMLLFVPSLICIIIGLILIPDCPMPCYFSGTDWF